MRYPKAVAQSSAVAGALTSIALMLAAADGGAQTPAAAVPVRELTVQNVSPLSFSNIFQVRQVAGGAVLVNDALRRQLSLLDSNLVLTRVVLDSITSSDGNGYGPVATPLISYLGDSSLLVDRVARALLLVGPDGTIVRTLSSPTTPNDFSYLYSSASAVDHFGNLVLRADTPAVTKRIGNSSAGMITEETQQSDSTSILRVRFDTRSIDTLVHVKQTVGMRSLNTHDANVRSARTRFLVNPIETLDDWAMLADGTIAIVRGGDYHIDYIAPDGVRSSSAKLPFDWKSISDADKQHILDSTRKAVDDAGEKAKAGGAINELMARREALIGHAMRLPGSPPIPERITATRPGQALPTLEYDFVSLNEMPSYYPPLRIGFTKGDADGNLWILPNTSAQSKAGELVYDVISQGVLFERVRIPLGRVIAGFGVNGVVYLSNRDTSGAWHLERCQVQR